MYLNQLTDAQLIERVTDLGNDILATSVHDFIFDNICAQYDAIVDELESRGKWPT